MWVCESEALPGVKWGSSSDVSRNLPVPIKCVRVEKPISGGPTSWATWWKIARMIEQLPIP
jgi:hypothetical protein